MVEGHLPLARAKNPIEITHLSVANLPPEEPDAVVPHVRVCEGASGQPLALLGENAENGVRVGLLDCLLVFSSGVGSGCI